MFTGQEVCDYVLISFLVTERRVAQLKLSLLIVCCLVSLFTCHGGVFNLIFNPQEVSA